MITWSDFKKIDMRIGTIIEVLPFPEARKPAYKLHIDFGKTIGIKKSSAQITTHYSAEELIGKQIVAVVNFSSKQIGPLISECLVMGSYKQDGSVILMQPDKPAENGSLVG